VTLNKEDDDYVGEVFGAVAIAPETDVRPLIFLMSD
jgi:hypothetical protein